MKSLILEALKPPYFNGPVPPFILAPFNEQQRIADKLDSLFARVDACRDRLAKVGSNLKIIRQSIFDAATSGEITKDWVYTDQPIVWQEVKLGEILADKPRNGYSPRAVDYETEIRSLALTATTSGYFDPKHIKYIDEDIPENSHLWLEPGDILIQRANSLEYVGVSAIYDGPSRGYIYPDLMMKCRANNRALTDYLYYLLSSTSVRSYFRKNATGTTGNMPKINQKIVLSVPVSIPPLNEQREIVERVKILLTHVERLESYYEHACSKLNKIMTSLLLKAFSGELVPQHLNDEPASDLLRRILVREEKTESKVVRTKKSKRKISNIKSNLDMLKREDIQPDHLSAILRENGSMQPENLWSSSQLEIDEFYEQLKEEEEKGLLREVRDESESASRLMEAI
jgi:type I restriction enzyme S subunit